ncbi:MAG TPA: Crp/Fnr family transcriptional regulator [Candidatus Limnocylindria bacterium]|nr:Crp/Fnr family transcriptional regulator [Candidatus Limnocylindria bacterium]
MAVSVSTVLSKVPFFAGVPADELEKLAGSLQRRTVRAGKAVFRQDDPGSSLYVIESGVVKVQRTSPEGKEVILTILGPGDFFGELALLDGEPRSADAVAKEDTALLVLERDDFLAFLDRAPAVATKLLAALSRRLRRTDQLVQDAAFLDVPARLARALLQLSESPEAATGLTQSELAAMVGASRESVNRWLQFYRRRGLIESASGSIRVLQPDELRRHIY